ncbi:YkoF-like protein, partial [Tirmania nivea]
LETLTTPPKCSADVCLTPIGTGTPSVANEIASIQRLLAVSGLAYTMHSAGTTIDGTWDEVMRVIGQFHTLVHGMGVVRIQSDIRVGTRTDKIQPYQDKVTSIQKILQ